MPLLIMVVDDEPAICEILGEWLTEEGYRVRCAQDGQEALDLVAIEPPAVIVSDVKMPRLDGITFVERLRAAGHLMPVILTSTWSTAGLLTDALRGVRFVAKPFDLADITAEVALSLAAAG